MLLLTFWVEIVWCIYSAWLVFGACVLFAYVIVWLFFVFTGFRGFLVCGGFAGVWFVLGLLCVAVCFPD